MSSLEWIGEAVCREIGHDVFFDEDAQTTSAAKNICGQCPVQTDCLNYALRIGPVAGVWGGTTASQRRRLNTRLRREAREEPLMRTA